MQSREIRSEIINYVERKRDSINSQVKAMEVDNCETQEAEEDSEHWEHWGANEYEELSYMGKGPYKGKGKGKGMGKSFNQFYQPSKGKGKSDYYQYQPYAKGDNQYKGDSGYKGDKGKGKGKGFQGQCYWCGEWGHSQSNCTSNDSYMNCMRETKGKGKGQEMHNVEEADHSR